MIRNVANIRIPYKRISRCWLVVTFALWLAHGAAFADAATEQAKNAFKDGQLQYNLGHFEDAAKAFSRAYALKPMPAFLFNIGQCHRNLKNHERAVFFFEGYLRGNPDENTQKLVEDLLAEETQLLAEERAQAHAVATAGDPNQMGGQESDKVDTPVDVATTAPATDHGPFPAPMPKASQAAVQEHPLQEQWWFWTALGGTAVALVVGGIVVASVAPQQATAKPPAAGSVGMIDAR